MCCDKNGSGVGDSSDIFASVTTYWGDLLKAWWREVQKELGNLTSMKLNILTTSNFKDQLLNGKHQWRICQDSLSEREQRWEASWSQDNLVTSASDSGETMAIACGHQLCWLISRNFVLTKWKYCREWMKKIPHRETTRLILGFSRKKGLQTALWKMMRMLPLIKISLFPDVSRHSVS